MTEPHGPQGPHGNESNPGSAGPSWSGGAPQTQWYGAPTAHSAGDAAYGSVAYGTPSSGTAPAATATPTKRPRRRYELPAVALLAALLASGTTYGVDQLAHPAPTAAVSSTSQTSAVGAPVIQADATAPNWSATAKAVSPSVVSIRVTSAGQGGQGSGVIIDTKGHVVTNNHVVTGAGSDATITVTLNDNRTYGASVVGTDPSTDLAVIQIKGAPDDLKPITMGDSDTLTVGEPVMAIGNPLGLAGTVTTGIVSALDRPVTTQSESADPTSGGEPVVTNAVQTSAAINPGNSGGALVNSSGELIGVNSAIASLGSGGGGQSGNIGIGFAIPVSEVRSIADQLITDGKAQHAFLGVRLQDTTVRDGAAHRAAAGVQSIEADSPASKAGLKAGDSVVAIDGDSVDGSLALVAQVRSRVAGQKATLTIVRDGHRQDVSITFGAK